MLIKPCFRVMALVVLATGFSACVHLGPRGESSGISQTSTITALLEGGYDGVITCGDLRKQGDFGIGTFDHLDGELIMIDGIVFQAKADGSVVRPPNSATVPFSAVAHFKPDTKRTVGLAPTYDLLKRDLDLSRSGNNLFYAFRVDGIFDYVKYRSVPPQVKPYPKLVDVAAKQPVFERRGIRGTLIGFWCPEYVRTLNLPGYHMHFISEDRKSAGHLLDCSWQGGTISSEVISDFHLALPRTPSFQSLNLGGDSSHALKAAESGK